MKTIKERINESQNVSLTYDECESLLLTLINCDLVKALYDYDDNVIHYVKTAVKKMENMMGEQWLKHNGNITNKLPY